MKCSIPVEPLAILHIFQKFPNSHSIFEYKISIGTEMGFSSNFDKMIKFIYWIKVKTLHLNCVSFIYKMMLASKANGSVSECSKTGLCITVKVLRMLSRGNTWKSFKCDRGPIFQVTNLNRNLTQFRASEINYQPDLTARKGSLDMWQPEIWRTYHKWVLIVKKSNLKKWVFHQMGKLEILTLKSQ